MKHLSYTLLFCLLVSLRAFAQMDEKPLVVASASMIHDMLEVIGGEYIETATIVPIGSDPHLYEPTPSDVQLTSDAQLILVNGLTFEGWLNELIDNSGTKAKTIRVTEGVNAIASEEYANSADPHAWMDVQNAMIYADNIRKALSELIPEEAETFQFNYNVYKSQLQDLDIYVQEQIATIPETQRILVTSHDAFSYYGRRYGLKLEALAGFSTEADPRTSDVIRVNKVISEHKLPAIFMESTINPKLLQQLAKDNDIKIGGKLYADSLGDKDGPAGSYIKMIRHNTDVIVTALKQTIDSRDIQGGQKSAKTYLWLLIPIGCFILGYVLAKLLKKS